MTTFTSPQRSRFLPPSPLKFNLSRNSHAHVKSSPAAGASTAPPPSVSPFARGRAFSLWSPIRLRLPFLCRSSQSLVKQAQGQRNETCIHISHGIETDLMAETQLILTVSTLTQMYTTTCITAGLCLYEIYICQHACWCSYTAPFIFEMKQKRNHNTEGIFHKMTR